ncbi:MAG: hypothetical protein U9Q23_00120 [Candidatus Bipolaricaulota bacterium]|nr:hypothetical protein [Candidatus Bipolaricaulota bacterium]
MGGYGNRNMYYATGLPGWVRFGYSPGWGGLPPGAQYLQNTGQTGAFLSAMGYQAGAPGTGPAPGMATPLGQPGIENLTAQKEALERQLATLKKRLEELEKEG